jgi:hypothetical protein
MSTTWWAVQRRDVSLYVNGEQLAQVQDARLTHGDVGLLAGSFDDPGVDVIFDNFVAIQP